MNILIGLICFFTGIGICLLCCYSYLKQRHVLNIETQKANEEIEKRNNKLQQTNEDLLNELNNLKSKQAEILSSITILQSQAEKAAQTFLEENMRLTQERLDLSAEQMSKDFEKYRDECEEEYLLTLKEVCEDFKGQLTQYKLNLKTIQEEIKEKEQLLENQRKLAAAAIEANKRQLEESDKRNYYRINITTADLDEVEKLRSIAPMFRNREPLDKVIWKTYYEKPTADLIARVVGANTKTGVYKITDIETGMTYIGQSVNISDRFKAHIKAGLGIDSSNNKLYTTMKEKGVENFLFEILEQCDRSQLNEKERFWIEFYQSESFGMNSTKGNK